MSLDYNSDVINSRLQVVATAIDAGSSNGALIITTAGGGTTLSSIILDYPCGTVAGGVLIFSGAPLRDLMTAASGEAAAAQITDSTGLVVASGLTVGISTSFDIVISTTTISSGNILVLNSASITGN